VRRQYLALSSPKTVTTDREEHTMDATPLHEAKHVTTPSGRNVALESAEVAEPTAAEKFAADLHELADWFAEHPEIEPPPLVTLYLFRFSREPFVETVRAMGRGEKSGDDSYFIFERRFGVVTLQATVQRDEVCRKVVVGTEEIPEQTTPAHTQDVVEWVCEEPLLASAPEAATS
jgi:hypothetical protein